VAITWAQVLVNYAPIRDSASKSGWTSNWSITATAS
jgi:hypothetical protein